MQWVVKRWTAVLVLAWVVSGCAASANPKEQHASGVSFLMSTWVEQSWHGPNAQKTYTEILEGLEGIENQISVYRAESEISKLNAQAGLTPVVLSPEVFTLLERAVAYGVQSDGLFDITTAPLSQLWGISPEQTTLPTPQAIEEARRLVGFQQIQLDAQASTAFLPTVGMKVDLGGIGKGWAASRMWEIAEKNGSQGYLSIGGNMMVRGKKSDGTEYVIGVRDPRGSASESIGSVHLDGLTMATTGDYERYFDKDGQRYHHILDPFTGYPRKTDLISVTVISADGALADCLSTTIFMAGSEQLPNYLQRQDCLVMAVTNQQEVFASPDFWASFQYDRDLSGYQFHDPNKF